MKRNRIVTKVNRPVVVYSTNKRLGVVLSQLRTHVKIGGQQNGFIMGSI